MNGSAPSSTYVGSLWTDSVDSWDSGDNGHDRPFCPQKNHSLFHRLFPAAALFFTLIPTRHRAY